MNDKFTAVIKQDGAWWIGWIEEVPGVNCQETTRDALIDSLMVTLREALDFSRDVPVARLVALERPGSPLAIHTPDPAGARLQDVSHPPPLALGIDIVELLLDERGER